MATDDGFKKYTQQLRAWDKGQKEQAKEGQAMAWAAEAVASGGEPHSERSFRVQGCER